MIWIVVIGVVGILGLGVVAILRSARLRAMLSVKEGKLEIETEPFQAKKS